MTIDNHNNLISYKILRAWTPQYLMQSEFDKNLNIRDLSWVVTFSCCQFVSGSLESNYLSVYNLGLQTFKIKGIKATVLHLPYIRMITHLESKMIKLPIYDFRKYKVSHASSLSIYYFIHHPWMHLQLCALVHRICSCTCTQIFSVMCRIRVCFLYLTFNVMYIRNKWLLCDGMNECWLIQAKMKEDWNCK